MSGARRVAIAGGGGHGGHGGRASGAGRRRRRHWPALSQRGLQPFGGAGRRAPSGTGVVLPAGR